MNLSPETLNEFYRIGWEQRWLLRLNKRFVPQDAGFKLRLLNTIKLITFSPDKAFTVLDLGCGVGIYGLQILKKFNQARIIGIDLSAEHIYAARKLAQNMGVSRRASFIVADVSNFRIDIEPDIILATEIIEHLPDPGPALHNIRKIAAPETRIIFSVPNRLHETKNNWVFYRQMTGENFKNIQTEKIDELDAAKPRYTFYHKEYTAQEIKALMINHGFIIEGIIFCYFQYPKASGNSPAKDWFISKLNYVNSRMACSFVDHLTGAVIGSQYAETIILSCRIEVTYDIDQHVSA
jgi:2-polyprenyl-3-methyl-5-hydroxy-6-metoxy-1,4-benzoquinol methylase